VRNDYADKSWLHERKRVSFGQIAAAVIVGFFLAFLFWGPR